MTAFWHRVGVYFGVAEQTPQEKADAAKQEPVPLHRRIFAIFAVVVVAGAGSALIDGDVWSGVRFGVFMAVAFTALDVYRSRRDEPQQP